MALFAGKRYEGTYMQVPKVDWATLVACNFNNPDWEKLYPINPKTNLPFGLLSPRLACKIFHDMILIIRKTEENNKYLQDRLPECTYKFYKKKQWRKQMIEGGKRLVCRLGKGMSLSPNCIGEDAFIHVALQELFGFGWKRIAEHVDPLPETERDRDYARVTRLAALEEIQYLYRLDETSAKKVSEGKGSGESKAMTRANTLKSKVAVQDVKGWFNGYERDVAHMADHFIAFAPPTAEQLAETELAESAVGCEA